MFKKLFSILTCIATFGVTLLGLASCNTKSNYIEVTGFATDKTFYTMSEEVNFDITIKLKKTDITVLAADIESNGDNKTFTVALTTGDNYHFSGKTNYDGETTRYKLKKIEYSYINDKGNLVAEELMVRNFSSNSLGESNDGSDSGISLKSLTYTNPEANDVFYLDQQINVEVQLNNLYQRKVTYFEFNLETKYAEETFTRTLSYKNVNFLNSTNYDFDLTLPSDVIGDSSLTLTKIKYIDNSLKEQTLNIENENIKCNFKIERRGITYQSISISTNDFKNVKYNGLTTVESGTQIPVKITLLNEDLMIPTKVTINGTEYNLSSTNYTTNQITKITTINLKIAVPTTDTSQITKVDVALEKITLVKNKDLTVNYTPKANTVEPVSINVVSKLIDTKEELADLFKNSSIKGYNLVTSNIDMQNSYVNTSKLEGTLDFQGKQILNWQSNKPMFSEIASSGVLKNITFQNAKIYNEENNEITYSGLLTTTNHGLINNIKISSLQQIISTKSVHKGERLDVQTNVGLVETNAADGVMTNIELNTDISLTWTSGYNFSYAPFFVNNYGKIAYVYFCGNSFVYNASAAYTASFNLLGEVNDGVITSVVFDLFAPKAQITTSNFNLSPVSGVGQSTHIYINETAVRNALSTSGGTFDINQTGTIGTLSNVSAIVSQKVLYGSSSITDQFNFFNTLGFNNSGAGFVWVYGDKGGKPRLTYK